jgi:MoxR-like ATPase
MTPQFWSSFPSITKNLEFFMRPLEVRQALACLVPLQRSIYLWGPPGVGKSSLVQQLARQQNLELIDLRVTLLDPVDLRGLPRLNKTKVDWCSPSFLPTKGSGILFLDELAQATPLVLAACLQLTLDRKIGEYQLRDGWMVIAASNRCEDRAGTHRLITPFLNRFIHLDLEVSLAEFAIRSATLDIRSRVVLARKDRPRDRGIRSDRETNKTDSLERC